LGLRPVSQANRWTMEANAALQSGRLDLAEASYQRAAAADPWNPEPSAGLANLYLLPLLQENNATFRERFETAQAAAQAKSSRDPALQSFLGDLRLHLYQRWGAADDLEAASQAYQRAAVISPANERLAAQVAAVLDAKQEPAEALRWAERAVEIAAAGGHVERDLSRVMILDPAFVGPAVRQQPQRVAAERLLTNRIGL